MNTNTISEVWREVPEYPGLLVSSEGEIKTRYKLVGCGPGSGKGARKRIIGNEWKPLKVQTLPSGYKYVQISFHDNGIHRRHSLYLHRLVAAAFIGPCPEGQEVRHKDNNRGNNRADNLQYGTRQQNVDDQLVHGTRRIGSRHQNAKLNEEKVLDIWARLERNESLKSIADRYGVSAAAIEQIEKGKSWRHVKPAEPRPSEV